ncbi:hypothetical protein BDV93DRAFT_567239 [Ceratobasidium sp. AG-I]|nr:hypothetical protein BDV93DRAFT_567239 [Ceratobasidium sp. AG-I]
MSSADLMSGHRLYFNTGRAIAVTLAADGAKVYIGSRSGEVVEDAAKEPPKLDPMGFPKHVKGCHYIDCLFLVPSLELDISDKESIKAGVKTVQTENHRFQRPKDNAAQTGTISSFVGDKSAQENKGPETLGNALFDKDQLEEWRYLCAANVARIFSMTAAFLGTLSRGIIKEIAL